MSDLLKKIIIKPDLCNSKSTIRGKRITVQTILEFLAAGDSEEEILANYPTLNSDDIKACLEFAAVIAGNSLEINDVA
jgi:uncharacterized protein (DUF433 family)